MADRTRARRKARPRVLVVYKKSSYTVYVREGKLARVEKLLARQDPTVARMRAADQLHGETMEEVRASLASLDVAVRFVPLPIKTPAHRSRLCDDTDLVITVGGDGTLLTASHYIGPDTPVLAVNSAPRFSVGFFCGVMKGEVHAGISDAVSGRMTPTRLARMKVVREGHLLDARVLNDVLFCAEIPAETSRYILVIDGQSEDQKSSGIWIGPAAGSTAAQRSAGGRVLRPTSRKLQYVVRELYNPQGETSKLLKGLVPPGQTLAVLNKMREGRLYIDGPYLVARVKMGERVELSLSDQPLSILGFPRRGGS